MANYQGVIIEESLVNKDVLKQVKIVSTKIEAVTEKHQTPWLAQWTLHTFEVDADRAADVAEKISESLDQSHQESWYADFKNERKHCIVFRNRIFFIDRRNKGQYEEAKEYGISIGIPAQQCDFDIFFIDGAQKIKACLIIKNQKGELLLQQRDEEPEIGKWVLFGGGVKAGETTEAALAREIKEELGYEIKSAEFFKEYVDNGIRQMIYVLNEPVEIGQLRLGEGAAMKFFASVELQNLLIGFNFKQILNEYSQSQN